MSKNFQYTGSIYDENALEQFFVEVFKTHEHRLYALALKLTKSDQLAKDTVQDVFLKLWEHRLVIYNIENMEAWLYRVTQNKVLDFLRKAAADDRLKEAIWKNLSEILNDTETLVAAREYNQIIQKAIDRLPPQRKLIYRLNKEAGLNYQEIANELSISKHTVKNQLFNAIHSVRTFIAKSVKTVFFFF